MAKVAADFDKIIKDARERKRNEALARSIFSRDRRQSAPTAAKPGSGPSLASRVGVKKRVASTNTRPSVLRGNVDGEWTHDLHSSVNDGAPPAGPRVPAPGARATRRVTRLTAALEKADVIIAGRATQPRSAVSSPGLTIRGLAGPFAVMAQNLAPGTTAADIESAMTPVGGEMLSCEVIKTNPIMLVEMTFATREGGERVIEAFNDKTADGRIIKVYPKPGASFTPRSQAPANAPSGPRAQRNAQSQVVDGTMGFSETAMDTDDAASTSTTKAVNGGLYSDQLVKPGRPGRGRGYRGGRTNR